jgi:O-antigen/teichoic acid export membrane protein
MRKKRALAINAFIQISGKLLATVFGLLTVVVLTRYLGVEGYGDFTIILGFLSVFAVLVDFGLTLTTVQMISEKGADEDALIGNLLSLRILSAIVFLALAPIVAFAFPYDAVVRIGIAVGAFSYLFGTTATLLVGVFQKRLVIQKAVYAELANRILVLVGALLAPALGLGLITIVGILLIGNAVQLIITLWLASHFVRLRLRAQFAIWREIISRSWPIGLSIFFNLIYLRGDILFLSVYRSSEEIGLYGAAYKVIDVITMIPVTFIGLLLPVLVALWSAKHTKKFRQSMQETFDLFSILSIPIAFGCVFVSVPLIILIAGAEFAGAGPALAVLGPAASIVFFGALFGHAVVAIEKQKPMIFGYLFVAIITVVGYMVFIPIYGIMAAAWMTLIAELLIAIITAMTVMVVSSFRPKIGMLSRAVFASIVMYLVLMILPEMHVLFLIATGGGVYTITLTAIGGPKPRDLLKILAPEISIEEVKS